MQNQNITVKLHNANKVISTFQATKGPDQPVIIQAKKNVNYEFIDAATQFAPENIKTKRVGNDLHVAFEDDRKHPFETDLIIEDYYNQDGTSTNLLIGLHENGSYYAYVPESGLQEHAVSLLADEIAAGQALGGEPLAAATYTFNPYWLLALIPLAGLAAVASDDSSTKGEKGATGPAGQDGADGKSAYELYVDATVAAGGTPLDLASWLDSLIGKNGAAGADGKSAYELYVDATVAAGGTPLDLASWLDSLIGKNGAAGADGKSAYDLYVETATAAGETPLSLENWLASLAGVNGTNGKSAYDLYVETTTAAGETPLSLTDWLASLKGDTGADGKSAYELYVDATVAAGGTPLDLASWLDSLIGKNGAAGADGKSAYDLYVETATAAGETPLSLENWLASLAGVNGTNGKSAYDLYVETTTAAGETPLSLTDWLASLKGDTGADGKSAYELYVDATVAAGGTPLDLASWLDSLIGKNGAAGADGKSAYDLYVETATAAGETPLSLENWLASLAGVNGTNGKSAYDLYVETTTAAGETPLSLTDWLASLKGDTGADGKSAYELYVDATVAAGGTPLDLASWLDSLIGKNGAAGADGKSAYDLYVETATAAGETPLSLENWLASLAGVNGTNGKSAYDLYVETTTAAGETPLSLTDWLASLKGDTGADGKSAYELYVDATVAAGGTPLDLASWLDSLIGKNGAAGADGKSAYDLYVETATAAGETPLSLENWLASLAGVNGTNGKSAYDLYVETTTAAGETPLSLTDWLASLKGDTGADGKSAYELYVDATVAAGGTPLDLASWLDSLIGKNGAAGADGKSAYDLYVETATAAGETPLSLENWLASLAGVNGTNGKSAYDLYVETTTAAGETPLSLTDWLASLKGDTGADGKSAYELYVDATVAAGGTPLDLASWLDSLIGKNGAAGADGKSAYDLYVETATAAGETPLSLENWLASLAGVNGTNGKSAYDLYVETTTAAGETPLSLTDWLASLKGDTGADGKSAYELYVDATVAAGGTPLDLASWLDSLIGKNGAAGADGKSAYDLYVETATAAGETPLSLENWLASLAGVNGTNGKSAYDLYVETTTAAGETPLSLTDWLASLKGDTGAAGADGLSAYELYLQGQANSWFAANPTDQTAYETYVAGLEEGGVALSASDWLEANVPAYATVLTDAGTETEAKWLESLRGTDGKDAYVLSKPIITENSEMTLAGTAKVGETVVILDGSGNVIEQILVEDGTFTISPNPLAGSIGSIYVTNALGEISDSFTLVGAADTTAPDLPVILLNDETQLSGTAEPNAKVIVIADGQAYETTVGPDGTWSFADINGPFNPLVKEGVSAAIIYAEDSAGNDSDPSLVFISENTAIVDLIESVVVVDDLNADDVINAFELGNDGQIQLDVNLGIDAAVGDLISVNGYNYVLNQADIEAEKITVSVNAREGENILVVTGINAAGQTERLQDSILVDTTAGTVTLDRVQPLETLPLSEILLNDMFINALESTGTVKLVGTAQPGSTLSIIVEGITEPFTATADSTGQWSIDLTPEQLAALTDGEISVTGTATDAAGNTAELSDSVTLDTVAPSVAITIAEDGIVTVIPTEPLYINGTLASLSDIADALTSSVAGGFAVVGDEIQFIPTDAYYGDITVTLPADTFTDLAGNPAGVVTATDLINFADAPTVLITSDNYSVVAGQTTLITFTFSELVNGFELSDASTNGAGTLSNLTQDLNNPLIYTAIFTPTVTDALEANITVAAGSYVSATTGKLGEAGQLQQLVGGVYENTNITGDTQVPDAPTVSLATDTGVSGSDGITADATVNVGITAGNTWRYSTDGGNTWSATWLDSTTNSFELPNDRFYPVDSIIVEQRDSAGNVSQGVLAQDVTLDTSTSITITSPTQISSYDKANGYVVKGTAEPNSTVTFTVEGIAKTFETTTDVTGHWTQLISPPDSTTTADAGDADTTITISATATDIAGNTATATKMDITSTTVADAIDVIAGDDIINGQEASDGESIIGISDITAFADITDYGVIYRLDENGARVNSPVHTFTTGSAGTSQNWTESLTQAQIQTLGNGQYEVVLFDDRTLLSPYTYSNPVASRKFTIDLDLTPLTYTVSDDDGALTPEGTTYITNDSTPTWSGTAEPNSAIEIIIGGKVVASAIADENGDWTATANQTLPDATHTVTIKNTDLAGNTRTDSQHTITVDTIAPVISIDQPIAGDNVLTDIEADQGLTIKGTAEGAEVGQTVTVTVEDETLTTTVALDPETALPIWSLTLTPEQLSSLPLTDLQVLDISATVTDKAGNVSEPDTATVTYKLADTDVLNTVVELSEAGLLNTETISASGEIIGWPSGTSTAYLEAPATELYVNGTPISWTGQNTQELIGSADGVEVIRITLNDAGEYTVTMSQAIEHGEPSTATDTQLAFDVRVNFANARGDVTESQYITVNVTDDVPVLAADRTEALSNTYVVEGNALVKTSADGITTAEINVDGTIFKIDYENQSITQTATGTADKVLAYNHIPAENGAGQLFITTERGELIKFDLDTGAYQYSIFAPLPGDYSTSVPVAVSLGGSNTLLGAVNADVAGLLEFENSQLFAVQGDGIYAVKIALGNVVDVGGLLGSLLADPKKFSYNTILANEFGFNITLTTAVLGIGQATLEIKAQNNQPLDTFKVNQLLSTVGIQGGLSELLNVGILPWTSITAYAQDGTTLATKDSVQLANVGLLNDLLSGETVSTILVDSAGRGSTLTKDGALEAWSIYGLDGADKIYGGNEGDHLYGGNGNDLIMGNEGDDYIIGGRGHDILYGGEGSDTFRWEKGDQVMTIGIATDIIKDFNADSAVLGGDILDLKGLLNGGGRLGFMPGNLTNYLHFSYDEVNDQTIIQISTEGEFVGGYQEASHTHLVDQVIVLEGVNLFKSTPSQTTADLHSDYEVIQNLIAQGKLDVALVDQVIGSNSTDINLSVTDTDGDTDSMNINIDTTNLAPSDFNPDNQAPWVFGKNTSLLGLVGLDVLSVINLGEQDIFVYDINNDLRKVELEFQQIVAVNVTKPTFGWSARLAQELGLKVEVIENEGVLGLIAPTTTLRITSASTELNISNSAINQLLATVKIGVQEGDLGIVNGDLLSLDVINTMQIRATDSHDLTTTETMGKLLDLDLATTSYRLNGDVNLVEGTDESDTNLDQSAASGSVLIYGYNGDDTITGSAYNDVIYGGIGNDVIHGGAGNDLIYGGAGDDTIHGGSGLNILNGGAGADTFVSTSGAQDVVIYDLQANDATGGHGQDTWNGFKVANVAFDTDADMLDLSELIADSFDEAHAQSLLENDATAYFSYMAQFIQLEQVADGSTINTLVKVDRDGSGEAFSATSLVTLTGVATDLEQLLQNGQILY